MQQVKLLKNQRRQSLSADNELWSERTFENYSKFCHELLHLSQIEILESPLATQFWKGLALISRLLKIIGLFCKRDL